jgi:hypothetical protein
MTTILKFKSNGNDEVDGYYAGNSNNSVIYFHELTESPQEPITESAH